MRLANAQHSAQRKLESVGGEKRAAVFLLLQDAFRVLISKKRKGYRNTNETCIWS